MAENIKNQKQSNNNELVDSEIIDDSDSSAVESINTETLEKVGDVISKIETSKQRTALAQIQATSEDNQRQFEYAMLQAKNANDRWNKSLIVGAVAVAIMVIVSIYLLINGDQAIGLGLLASTFSGVFGYLAGAGAHK
ncbi:hypothetical protein [Campylobacter sp. RM16187]|uniref:hypothetical protein n=1 Tax=Campylobacter sp. RM16187 TaxID=1660063 RepID=UPI0021B50510|nr:hypothetical protein [Campylobacter sp. RM16187]QKG29184.1 hypothetical protein CDOMF_0920 [Campylobacter sp. RM16187]